MAVVAVVDGPAADTWPLTLGHLIAPGTRLEWRCVRRTDRKSPAACLPLVLEALIIVRVCSRFVWLCADFTNCVRCGKWAGSSRAHVTAIGECLRETQHTWQRGHSGHARSVREVSDPLGQQPCGWGCVPVVRGRYAACTSCNCTTYQENRCT